jgi:hypothetical protein
LYIHKISAIDILFISPTLALYKSALTISLPSIMVETDNFKVGGFIHLWLKEAKKVNMLILYQGINAIVNFFHITNISSV